MLSFGFRTSSKAIPSTLKFALYVPEAFRRPGRRGILRCFLFGDTRARAAFRFQGPGCWMARGHAHTRESTDGCACMRRAVLASCWLLLLRFEPGSAFPRADSAEWTDLQGGSLPTMRANTYVYPACQQPLATALPPPATVLHVPSWCETMVESLNSSHWKSMHWSERFADMTTCFGETYLTTRAQLGNKRAYDLSEKPCWATLIRRRLPSGAFDAPHLLLPIELHMSHNTALVCVNDTLHVFGGQHNPKNDADHQPGTLHTSMRKGESFTLPRLIFNGVLLNATHCVEKRQWIAPFPGTKQAACVFDGKFSVVYWRSLVWFFARANLSPRGGSRHVQVSTSPDFQHWSTWRVLKIAGVTAGDVNDDNIYYLNVQVIEDRLVGLFPGVLNDRSGIYLTTSEDGIVWSKPRLVLPSTAYGPRVEDHPAAIFPPTADGDLYVLGPINFLDSAFSFRLMRMDICNCTNQRSLGWAASRFTAYNREPILWRMKRPALFAEPPPVMPRLRPAPRWWMHELAKKNQSDPTATSAELQWGAVTTQPMYGSCDRNESQAKANEGKRRNETVPVAFSCNTTFFSAICRRYP